MSFDDRILSSSPISNFCNHLGQYTWYEWIPCNTNFSCSLRFSTVFFFFLVKWFVLLIWMTNLMTLTQFNIFESFEDLRFAVNFDLWSLQLPLKLKVTFNDLAKLRSSNFEAQSTHKCFRGLFMEILCQHLTVIWKWKIKNSMHISVSQNTVQLP